MTEKDKRSGKDAAQEEEKSWREDQEQEEEYIRQVDIPEDQEHPSLEEEPTGFLMVDQNTEAEAHPLKEEELEEFLVVDTNEEAIMDEIDEYTSDEEIDEDFEERQGFTSGSEALADKLRQHHSKKPDLSGGDVDAAWEDIDVSGEEGVGGTTPTPDQDVVDELGEAVGISYDSDEPLNTDEKLLKRDRNRWELDPASAEDSEPEPESEEEEEEG